MSVWGDLRKKSLGQEVRMEDCAHIEIKVKGKEIRYGKVKTKFVFNNLDNNQKRDKWYIVADHYLTNEEVSKFCLEHGVNIHRMSLDDWKSGAYWKKLSDAVVDTFKQARDTYDGTIIETHTYKKTDYNCYLISFKLHWGNGGYRQYNLPIELDIQEYRKEVGFPITIAQYIDGEVETLLDPAYWNGEFKFKWKMTREEWNNDDNFSQIKSYVHDQRERLKYEGYSF